MKQEIADRLNELPPFPQVVLEVLALLEAGEADYPQVERLIRQDASLSVRVLRLANSAFYGFSGQIGSVRDACLVLGSQTLRQVVVAVAAMAQLGHANGAPFDQRRLWQHGMGVAAAASVIARSCRCADGALASTAGLLHDLGKLVLNAHFPNLYRDVQVYQLHADCPVLEAERAVLETDHSEVGAIAATRWRLPGAVVAVIQDHHTPGVSADPLTDLVNVADVLARALAVGDPGDDLVTAIDDGAWQRLALDMDRLVEGFPEVERVRGLDLLGEAAGA